MTLLKTEIYQDNNLKKTFDGEDSSNQSFIWLLNNQGQSTDYALRWGGWKVTDFYSDGTQENWKPYSI